MAIIYVHNHGTVYTHIDGHLEGEPLPCESPGDTLVDVGSALRTTTRRFGDGVQIGCVVGAAV